MIQNQANPQSLNRYAYCKNNPLKYIDPTGHWGWGDFWDFVKGVGEAVVNTVVGTLTTAYEIVTNPVNFVCNTVSAFVHYEDTWNAIKSYYDVGTPRGLGHLVGDIAVGIAVGIATAGVGTGEAAATKGASVSQRTILIGENMERVIPVAEKMGAETFGGNTIPANRAWIEAARDAGAKVYDIGPDFERRMSRLAFGETQYYSPFYNIERQILSNYPIS